MKRILEKMGIKDDERHRAASTQAVTAQAGTLQPGKRRCAREGRLDTGLQTDKCHEGAQLLQYKTLETSNKAKLAGGRFNMERRWHFFIQRVVYL